MNKEQGISNDYRKPTSLFEIPCCLFNIFRPKIL